MVALRKAGNYPIIGEEMVMPPFVYQTPTDQHQSRAETKAFGL